MIDRNAWNVYHRPDRQTAWTWLASGESYGSANGAGLLKAPKGERAVLFGRTLPDAYGNPAPLVRRPR